MDTPYVFLCDMDFLPSKNMAALLATHLDLLKATEEEEEELERQDDDEPDNTFGKEQVDEVDGKKDAPTPEEHHMEEHSHTDGGNTATLHGTEATLQETAHAMTTEEVTLIILKSKTST